MELGLKVLSDIKFFTDYAKYNETEHRKETWHEAVERVMKMHRTNPKLQDAFKHKDFNDLFELATSCYKDKLILGSQRALQFGGEPIMKHNSKMYNCLTSYCDRVAFFQECMYWLLSGCGVGFSVQYKHISKLPGICSRTKGTKTFIVNDSIEGWSDAFGVLMSSFVQTNPTFPEYQGYIVHFDLSNIRPEGSFISGGFKAPGPEGLRKALIKVENLLEKNVSSVRIKPIVAYDIVMHMADAVLSGGVRRSATICLFSKTDIEMLNAKTGNWYYTDPQRSRSNNSVVLLRNLTTKEEFDKIIESVKQFGEPGFIWTDDEDILYNPCVEIGMYPQTEDGRSGWQGCNLTTINGGMCKDKETFLLACKASAILGTIQASYTDFKYVGPESKEIFERESLLGCSVTGWMSNPKILFDEELLRTGAQLILNTNKSISLYLDINPCARGTCVKPEGNSSVLLMTTTSGVHGDHSELSFRVMQINKGEEIAQYINKNYPKLIEESVHSENNTDFALFVPVKARKGTIYKDELLGVKQLEKVKFIQQSWVEAGTDLELCVKPYIRHNVSNTVMVDNYEDVANYIYDNRQYFAGVSLMPYKGDKIYPQAPFTKVITPEQIYKEYGEASMFASGLIVDALHVFDNNLWIACDSVINKSIEIDGTRTQVLLKKDWIRRAKQFAKRSFGNNLIKMTDCLKDLNNYHKWLEINREIKGLNIEDINSSGLLKPEYTNIDTLGAVACAGGACEVVFN